MDTTKPRIAIATPAVRSVARTIPRLTPLVSAQERDASCTMGRRLSDRPTLATLVGLPANCPTVAQRASTRTGLFGGAVEPYRVSQRVHLEGGWSLWDDRVGIHRR